MPKCIRCNAKWPWTRVNELGLCRSCEAEYLAYNLRTAKTEIPQGISRMRESDNLELRWKGGNQAYEKLLRLEAFSQDKIDFYAVMFSGGSLNEVLKDVEKDLDILIEAANQIEKVVFEVVIDDLTIPRAEIDKAVTEAILDGRIREIPKPEINIKATMYDMLQRLEFEKKLYKRKIASRYIYCLHPF